MKQNITEGNLFKAFVFFMTPMILTSVLQQSYVIADGLILGNAVSEEALGAVSGVGTVLDFFLLIQIGISSGCSVSVSHLCGAGDYQKLAKMTKGMLRLILAISLAASAAGILGAAWILRILHTPAELFSEAHIYLTITFTGIPFMAIYNLEAGILRGLGDSKKPLGGILLSSVINIGLDLLLVAGARLGIAGAAAATVCAEGLSAFFLYEKLRGKMKAFGIAEENSADWQAVKDAAALGLPQTVQSVFTSGGKILLQNVMNLLGAAAVIGVTVAYKADSLVVIPMMGIASSVSVFTGQNLGAGLPSRAWKSLRTGIAFAAGFAAAATGILWFWGFPLLQLFGVSDTAAGMGYRYLSLCFPFYWVFGLQFVLNGFLQGTKKVTEASAISCISFGARVLVCYLGYQKLQSDILPVSEIISWILGAALALPVVLQLRFRHHAEK